MGAPRDSKLLLQTNPSTSNVGCRGSSKYQVSREKFSHLSIFVLSKSDGCSKA